MNLGPSEPGPSRPHSDAGGPDPNAGGPDPDAGREPLPGTGITVAQTLAELRTGAVLVDVRTPSEYRHQHAPMAINVQLGWVSTEVPLIADGRTVITICSYGNRSSQAARLLAGAGHRAFYVHGGLTAWQAAGERAISTPTGGRDWRGTGLRG